MSFASRLKDARLAKGYTQEKLAELIGAEVSLIDTWERGKETRIKDIPGKYLTQLCIVLDCSPNYLFGWKNNAPLSALPREKHIVLLRTTINRKIFYNHTKPPQMVRIKSEALCLDHTFSPMSSGRCLGIGDCIKLANSPYIDSVHMLLAEENNAYYLEPLTDIGKVYLLGWVDAGLYEDGGGIE